MFSSTSVVVAAALSVSIFAGCGHNADRVELSGTVTFAGKPVQHGQIRFLPIEDTQGPVTIAQIEDGKYAVTSHEGVPVGRLRVEIRGYDMTGITVPMPGTRPPKQLLPEKYNDKTTLTLTVSDSTGYRITHDFDLTP